MKNPFPYLVVLVVFLCLHALFFVSPCAAQTVTFFEENFEDSNLGSRGWYDNTNVQLSTVEHLPGSVSSIEFHFLQGATSPPPGGAIRKKFTATNEVYISYYVKYSSNWTGSNRPYHPHEFLVMTNQNGSWDGPSYSHLTAYIEQNEGTPWLCLQDGQNIDETKVGQNLVNVTENRGVTGCNGDSDGYGAGDCYLHGTYHYNGKVWSAGSIFFQDASGPYYKNSWHHIEAYFKLNSISNGKGVPDGIIRYWYDGQLIIDHSNVMMRTGEYPGMMFNQFLMTPYIGDGSPVDQTLWVDNLIVGNSRPVTTALSPPTNLRMVQ